jgi:hypothetical protein
MVAIAIMIARLAKRLDITNAFEKGISDSIQLKLLVEQNLPITRGPNYS